MTRLSADPPEGPADVTLVAMSLTDLDDVAAIESVSFRDAWPRDAFAQECHNPFSRPIVAHDSTGRTVAYMILWVAGPECHVVNVAVRPDLRGKGLGRLMIEEAERVAIEARCEFIYLEVRPSNEIARGMYERHGFEVDGRRRGYYQDGEDALVMVRYLGPQPDA